MSAPEHHDTYSAAIRKRVNARDLWMFVVTILVVLSLGAAGKAITAIEAGRRGGTKLTCAISGAVVQGGREVIESTAEQPTPPKLERFLVPFGYPSLQARQAAAKASGRSYTEKIGEKIEHVAGATGAGILNPDGTVNCDRLRDASRVR